MYRVILPSLLVATLSGCSMGTSSISSGFAQPVRTASLKKELPPSRSLGRRTTRSKISSNKSRKRQFASLGKAAASGASTSTSGRSGQSDRTFGGARLDIEKARRLINAYRKSKGLKPLRIDVKLTRAAKAHARDLARWDRISHYGSDGSNPWDRVKRTGYNAKLAAENVGTGQKTIEEVFRGWKKSPGHNKNLLLADAEQMGIALVYDPKTEFKTFWTLVIGSKL